MKNVYKSLFILHSSFFILHSSFFSPVSLWAYQVTGIEFVRFAERFPQVSPLEDSGESVKRGFVAFRNVCMNCHAINGEGGGKARDLY
jgi:mono/diheme cytochrome c family protein